MSMNLFCYSEKQLDAIFNEIQRAGLSETNFNLDELENAANSFLDESIPPPAEKAEEYGRIAENALNLRISLATVLDDQLLDAHAESIDAALCRIEDHARDQALFWREGESPKNRFYWRVLDCWCTIGGKLGYSRNVNSGARGGPTVRYFEAAVGPVLGGKMPGREAIAKIIKRHNALFRELDALHEHESLDGSAG